MDRAEAGLRAQTGEKPGGGYYTNPERITLQKFALGRITRLPSSVFGSRVVSSGGGNGTVGGGGAGGGGVSTGSAIVVRPQVSLIDRTQNLEIQTTQQSVGSLQQNLDVINVRVTELNQGLNTIGQQLSYESALEQNQLKQQQEEERRLAERKVRAGKESELEKNIQAVLARPIIKLQQTITGLFSRIMGALTTLFFGWLTNQGIETLKAFSEGNTNKLESIKKTVIKNVLFAIGAFAAVHIGFGLLMRTITGLTLRLTGLVARIALSPFRLAGRAISKLLGIGGEGAAAVGRVAGRVPITTSGGKILSRSGGILDRFLGGVKGLGKGAGSVLRGAGDVASKVFTPLALGVGTYRIAKGDIVGGLLSYGSAIPGIGLGFAGLDVAREFGFGKGTFFGKKEETQKTSKVKPASQPQTPANPATDMSNMSFNIDTSNTLQAPAQLLNAGENTSPETLQSPTPAANIQPPPKASTPVGTLPELKPNIIMAGGGTDRTQTIASQQDPLTDVPFIPSGNTDNFYVLYSQLNYNVVM